MSDEPDEAELDAAGRSAAIFELHWAVCELAVAAAYRDHKDLRDQLPGGGTLEQAEAEYKVKLLAADRAYEACVSCGATPRDLGCEWWQ